MAMKVQGGKMVDSNATLKQGLFHNKQQFIDDINIAYAKLGNAVIYVDRMKSILGPSNADINAAETALFQARQAIEKATQRVNSVVQKMQ